MFRITFGPHCPYSLNIQKLTLVTDYICTKVTISNCNCSCSCSYSMGKQRSCPLSITSSEGLVSCTIVYHLAKLFEEVCHLPLSHTPHHILATCCLMHVIVSSFRSWPFLWINWLLGINRDVLHQLTNLPPCLNYWKWQSFQCYGRQRIWWSLQLLEGTLGLKLGQNVGYILQSHIMQ